MKQGPEEKDIKSIKSSWNIHLHYIWVFKLFTKNNFFKKNENELSSVLQ